MDRTGVEGWRDEAVSTFTAYSSAPGHATAMRMKHFLLIGLLAVAVTPADAARRKGDQDKAYAAHQSGQIMALHDIESRIIPKMPGCDYLGPEFDAYSGVYRLKFMRGGTVIYVDVDGRTGQIIGRSGS